MVNPKIIEHSTELQSFRHACLSIPSPNRCDVKSPQTITVQYQDFTNNMKVITKTLAGMDAVVLWHEMHHILDGKTYINAALAALSQKDLATFKQLIADELITRKSADNSNQIIPVLTVPPFHPTVIIDASGTSQLNQEELERALPKFTRETLEGLIKQCDLLEKKAAND